MSLLRLRGDHLQWVDVDGEVVALDETALTYLSANESAAVLWRELTSGTTREQLAERLVERFELDAAQAQADVDLFLADLQARGLLETE